MGGGKEGRREAERGAGKGVGVWCKYLFEIVCADTIGNWNTAYHFRSSFSLHQF